MGVLGKRSLMHCLSVLQGQFKYTTLRSLAVVQERESVDSSISGLDLVDRI